MICVLDVTAGPARGRRFWIRAEEKLEIGRISTADFSVPTDRHMSRHHLILEGHASTFRLRDVGSANGTYVNNSRVSAIELCNGDKIKAGETVFEVSVIQDSENPHAKDVTFNSSVMRRADAEQGSQVAEEAVASSVGGGAEKVHASNVSSHNDLDFSHDDKSTSRVADSRIISNDEDDSSSASMSSNWVNEFLFELDAATGCLVQSEKVGDRFSVSDLLTRLEPIYAITAIVNHEGVRKFNRQLIETLVEEGLVTSQSPSVCSIMNSCSRDFHLLMDSLISEDSLILLGTKSGMDPNVIADVALKAARPSKLEELIRDQDNELRRQLSHEADFVLFEVGGTSRLQLLRRENSISASS